jgi:hypothetical protein
MSPTMQPPNVGVRNTVLYGVAATSDCKVWAVGKYWSHSFQLPSSLLIEYWDGTAWTIQESPPLRPFLHSLLYGVAATSSTNAWAVGSYESPINDVQPLIERWNGTDWQIQSNPSPGISTQNFFSGVAATSPTNAWAVGQYEKNLGHSTAVQRTLIEHWDGTAWTVQKSPNVPRGKRTIFSPNSLNGVSATSPTNAWAVGSWVNPDTANSQTLIEHWDGTAWKTQKSPNPHVRHGDTVLSGVAATSRTNAWAVGYYLDIHCLNPGCTSANEFEQTLILHWNGTAWTVQKSPNPGGSKVDNSLTGVVATSATNAWAVGNYGDGEKSRTLTLHWNGTAWKIETSPNPDFRHRDTVLSAVTATSPTNAWAVGKSYNTTQRAAQTLALRWNGTAWGP